MLPQLSFDKHQRQDQQVQGQHKQQRHQQQQRPDHQHDQEMMQQPELQLYRDAWIEHNRTYALPLLPGCSPAARTRLPQDESSWEARAFAEDVAKYSSLWPPRFYACRYCSKEFPTAQALGGHMNVHRRERAHAEKSTANAIVAREASLDGCWLYLLDPSATSQSQMLQPTDASDRHHQTHQHQYENGFSYSLALGSLSSISGSTNPSSSILTKSSLSSTTGRMNWNPIHTMELSNTMDSSDAVSDISPQLSDQQSASKLSLPEAIPQMLVINMENGKHIQKDVVAIENGSPVLDLELRLGLPVYS